MVVDHHTMEKYLREVGYDFMQLVAENEDWKDAYVSKKSEYLAESYVLH